MKRNAECLQNQDILAASLLQGTPFDNLCLTSQAILERAQKQGRSKCPRCHGSRMFYCYSCYVPVETVPVEDIPIVKLPLKIDIIKHPNETDGKSTAVHAKLLASEDVTVYTYPCIPDYEEIQHEIALIFPGPNSVSISNIPLSLQAKCKTDTEGFSAVPAPKCAKLEPSHSRIMSEDKLPKSENALKKIIFIDSTWNQTNKIITDERLQGLLQIELKSKKTCFWRHQKGKPETYLSTIEAIYYFLVDYHKEVLKEKYDGQYDNLLFFFSFMYRLIRKAKDSAGKK
ncbi:PREDICTED: DTW domain-containing protein 1 [Thamnophis sirtalis]|uniref:tRNA-uridine aminocarboxypropyltransferase 1 n=1 Tax=Thamnophis sirtalis TaxID=35019 RepID=A0A6I9YCQ1_9SAUR|nr:PREDICTED: DTW domain-containing protein 1 [Thamnophis sirtalis]XP_013921839.1 PREDICTED: DTW domain-containing protein 1 [Thamnophis sirtalis]XP_013921840.1 PREDICTED: DTW domain-containing protein 1 [Thamnophis sirtalis]XP_013921841.1 PREDICTED: DTW domain-containing protein 1 [Thamnophis sirtalis]XP_013921843.1 PREDICTED: DTW domain-containing protein 1 [Thamnophis sirtalis]